FYSQLIRFLFSFLFFSTAPSPPGISTLSLHDALPIWSGAFGGAAAVGLFRHRGVLVRPCAPAPKGPAHARSATKQGVKASYHNRSEEHTSELQSLRHLVCRLLLEKKKKIKYKK